MAKIALNTLGNVKFGSHLFVYNITNVESDKFDICETGAISAVCMEYCNMLLWIIECFHFNITAKKAQLIFLLQIIK